MLELMKGTVTPRDWVNVVVIFAVALLLGVGFWYLVISNQETSIVALEQSKETTQIELREARKVKEGFEEFKAEAQKWEQVVQLFEERLPEDREIPRLMQTFENIGADIGLSVELSQQNRMRDSSKETIPYKVVARGDFHQIVTFINLLEREQRYLMVSDLDIGPEEAGIAEANFTLSTFRFLLSTSSTEEEAS